MSTHRVAGGFGALVVPLMVVTSVIASADSDARQSYRFTVTSSGAGHAEFRGLLTVDGKTRVLGQQRTPFEFQCEAGSVITGYFEILTPGRELKLKVIDPAYSRRRAAASARGVSHVRFAWARPGVGPRCIDFGAGACPSSVPGFDELRRLLDSNGQTANPRVQAADSRVTTLAEHRKGRATRPAPDARR